MRRRYQHGKRRGLTLIEVVVGLAIAGALLSTVIIASSHHAKQMRLAHQKRAAAELVDRFLSRWSHYDFRSHEAERVMGEFDGAVSPGFENQFALKIERRVERVEWGGYRGVNVDSAVVVARVSVFDTSGRRVTSVDVACLGQD